MLITACSFLYVRLLFAGITNWPLHYRTLGNVFPLLYILFTDNIICFYTKWHILMTSLNSSNFCKFLVRLYMRCVHCRNCETRLDFISGEGCFPERLGAYATSPEERNADQTKWPLNYWNTEPFLSSPQTLYFSSIGDYAKDCGPWPGDVWLPCSFHHGPLRY